MMLRLWMLFLSAIVTASSLTPLQAKEPPNKRAQPNIILIMADDIAYDNIGCYGSTHFKTPCLDELAKTGVKFNFCYSEPVCTASRVKIMTGRDNIRNYTVFGKLDPKEQTFGTMMQEAGYATAIAGKWQLHGNNGALAPDCGFDTFCLWNYPGTERSRYWNPSLLRDGKKVAIDENSYGPKICTDFLIEFIEQKRDKPFFAYYPMLSVHSPFLPTPDSKNRKHKNAADNYRDMVSYMDKCVQRLVDTLDKNGLRNNTIVIFTTDNGTSAGDRVFNSGMRGKKGSEYDGGHRVPMFIRWPVGDLRGGRDVETITAYVDVLPTLIELCGVEAPKNINFDGVSIKPLLDGKQPDAWPDRILVTDSQRVKDPIKWRKSAVMTSTWRLNNGKELYNIKSDPGQKQNVAASHPQVVQRLTDFYDQWWAEIEPSFKNATAIYLGHPDDNPARLTSHDWITTGSTPWNQSQVRRAMNGKGNTGFWNVKVFEPGEYQFRLRRWPEEVDLPIAAPLAPGAPVPGAKAYRTADGLAIKPVKATLQIGDVTVTKPIGTNAKEVTFDLTVKAGKKTLSASFESEDGTVHGAYFVYVTRK